MQPTDTPEIYFQETQRFREPWLWALLFATTVLSFAIAVWILTWPVDQGEDGVEPALKVRIAIAAFIVLGDLAVVCLLFVAKLQTEVNSRGLFLRFYPFHLKVRNITLDSAVAITPVEYKPLQQYGGWGIRRIPYGTAYNVKGNEGVRIDYDNDCHVLVGSQHPFELSDALHAVWTPPEGYVYPEYDGDEDNDYPDDEGYPDEDDDLDYEEDDAR